MQSLTSTLASGHGLSMMASPKKAGKDRRASRVGASSGAAPGLFARGLSTQQGAVSAAALKMLSGAGDARGNSSAKSMASIGSGGLDGSDCGRPASLAGQSNTPGFEDPDAASIEIPPRDPRYLWNWHEVGRGMIPNTAVSSVHVQVAT